MDMGCRSVVAWRKWLHGRGGGGWQRALGQDPAPPPPLMPREALLDRYHQHTRLCPSCKKVSLFFDMYLDVYYEGDAGYSTNAL